MEASPNGAGNGLVPAAQLARELGIAPRRLRKWTETGRVRVHGRQRNALLVERREVEEVLAASRVGKLWGSNAPERLEVEQLRDELRAAVELVRAVGQRLLDVDRERARYEAAEARLQLEAGRHSAARSAYLAKRSEISEALARGTLREEARRSVGRRG